MYGHGSARLLAATFAAVLLAGCVPIKVAEQHVLPQTRSEPVAEDWDPTVGPDVHQAFVHRFAQAMRALSDRIEVVDADTVWRAADPGREPGTEAKLSEVLTAQGVAGLAGLGVRFLIVLGTQTEPARRHDVELGFYSKRTVETAREAVLIGIALDGGQRLKFVAQAVGTERDGWFPASLLLFARLYTTSDTEESALGGVARQVVDRVLERGGDGPARVAVLAAKAPPRRAR
jgi:hypothetical protein